MPLSALALLLLASALHAGWNVVVKRAKEKQVFMWWALLSGTICFAPLLLVSKPLPLGIWPYVVASAVLEALYYLILTQAYEYGDFSLIYPMARGSAPALLLVWAILFLGERPRLMGIMGIALLVAGLLLVGGKAWWALRNKTTLISKSAIVLALSVACCISLYSAVDGAAVQRVAATPYTVLVIGLSTMLITPVVLIGHGRKAVVEEWRTNWLSLILVGILMFVTYILVLQAYSIARVSYAGAVREISVVFAAFLGWRWLGEDFGALRVVGALIIFTAILVIAVAG